MKRVWTAEQIRALGVRCDGVTACEIVYGVRKTKAYELLAAGEVDFPVLRRGANYAVPTSAIRKLLGIDDREAVAAVRVKGKGRDKGKEKAA